MLCAPCLCAPTHSSLSHVSLSSYFYFGQLINVSTSYTETEQEPLTSLLEIETESVEHLHQHHHGNDDEVSDRGHGVVVEANEIIIENDMWVNGLRVQVENAPRSITQIYVCTYLPLHFCLLHFCNLKTCLVSVLVKTLPKH